MTYGERLRQFVSTTAGMNNVWSLKTHFAQAARAVRINGLFGEALRSSIRATLEDTDDAAAFWVTRFGELGLVNPDVEKEYVEHCTRAVLGAGPVDASPYDIADGFRLAEQVRSNFGPREDHSGAPRIFPLSSIDAVRAAFALGHGARVTERVHHELMARASPVLVDERFTDAGWPTPPRPGRRPAVLAERRRRKGPASKAKAENLHQLLDKADASTPQAALAEVFADDGNDAWAILDRSAAISALERLDQLSSRQRQELYGAATAVLWLGAETPDDRPASA
jgi:hypothetical protein